MLTNRQLLMHDRYAELLPAVRDRKFSVRTACVDTNYDFTINGSVCWYHDLPDKERSLPDLKARIEISILESPAMGEEFLYTPDADYHAALLFAYRCCDLEVIEYLYSLKSWSKGLVRNDRDCVVAYFESALLRGDVDIISHVAELHFQDKPFESALWYYLCADTQHTAEVVAKICELFPGISAIKNSQGQLPLEYIFRQPYMLDETSRFKPWDSKYQFIDSMQGLLGEAYYPVERLSIRGSAFHFQVVETLLQDFNPWEHDPGALPHVVCQCISWFDMRSVVLLRDLAGASFQAFDSDGRLPLYYAAVLARSGICGPLHYLMDTIGVDEVVDKEGKSYIDLHRELITPF